MASGNADWNVPPEFNFARDVVEPLAADPNRRALTHVDSEGVIQRLTFSQVATDAARRGCSARRATCRATGCSSCWAGCLPGSGSCSAPSRAGSSRCRAPRRSAAATLHSRARHCEASLLIADRSSQVEVDVMRSMLDTPIDVLYTDDASLLLQRQPMTAPTERTSSSDYAFILYTSGTTKEPKGRHAYPCVHLREKNASRALARRPVQTTSSGARPGREPGRSRSGTSCSGRGRRRDRHARRASIRRSASS